MSLTDEEYAEKVLGEVEHWVRALAKKGKSSFKITECKEDNKTPSMSSLTTACEALVERNILTLDPSSRRIAVYILDDKFVFETKAEATAAEEVVEPPVKKARKVEATEEHSEKKEKPHKAPAPPAKKQKVAQPVPLGTKKIFAFFQVQEPAGRPPAASAPATIPAPISIDTASAPAPVEADENTSPATINTASSANSFEPPKPTTNTATTKPNRPAADLTTIQPTFAPVLPMPAQVVEHFFVAPAPAGTAERSVTKDLMELVTRLVLVGFQQHSGTMDVAELLTRCAEEHQAGRVERSVDEADLRSALRELEDRNAVMVDEGVVYEV